MRSSLVTLAAAAIGILAASILGGCAPVPRGPAHRTRSGETPRAWPHPFAVRTADETGSDLFVMTLGDVSTPLADAVFDPATDTLTRRDGSKSEHHVRDRLGIRWFHPIDKSAFPSPPAGWCSWYSYYQEISADDVKRNARALGERLLDFGARWCQVDDGWQGTGHGLGENRDWTTIDKRFPAGMADLAAFIRKQGLEPGIWIAPHGQSNETVVRESKAFLLEPDGRSASSTWEGTFLVDPTRPEGLTYLEALFRTMRESWGFSYFKIDGQPIVVDELTSKRARFAKPDADPIEAYRESLLAIRRGIGRESFLLGCWGVPLDGVGIMNGSRTGGDVVLGWEGFKTALDATMSGYFLHNVAWYADPDVVVVRPPLTIDMARAWATLLGLTGQATLTSDPIDELPESRLELLKRILPAADIRPLDLFPAERRKTLLDLKVSHLGRRYDVVACFNLDDSRARAAHVSFEGLGLDPTKPHHLYDFWAREYLGCFEGGAFFDVPPAACRVLTVMEAEPRPQLLSTSRHVTQGPVELEAYRIDEATGMATGSSRLIGGDSCDLVFAFPRSGRTYRVTAVEADGAAARFVNGRGHSVVSLVRPKTGLTRWGVAFEAVEAPPAFPVKAPGSLQARVRGLDAVELSWPSTYEGNAGYLVIADGKPAGVAAVRGARLSRVDLTKPPEIEVKAIWFDGTTSEKAAALASPLELPAEIFLSDLEPVRATQGWGSLGIDRSVSGGPLRIGERTFQRGLGTHALSDLQFALAGRFVRFLAEVGVDSAQAGKAREALELEVYGDEKLLWKSGRMSRADAAKAVDVDVTGVSLLRLHVGDGGDGIDYDHADWASARVAR